MKKYEDVFKATLLGYTKPVDNMIGIRTPEDLIAYCTKVSNPSGQYNFEKVQNLIDFLIKHKHWSPFEMASATLEITTTRDIARQLLRHRSFSFQEFSQRYADPSSMKDTFVIREARLQDNKNRQNSIATDDEHLQKEWAEKQESLIALAKIYYNWAISNGIAKEQARVVLPEGNTLSKLYVNGTIRSWIHYIELRSANGTQLEHMKLAVACAEAIKNIYPAIVK